MAETGRDSGTVNCNMEAVRYINLSDSTMQCPQHDMADITWTGNVLYPQLGELVVFQGLTK